MRQASCGLTKFCGGRTGTRTLDPLIKSQLLYQLSYAPGSIINTANVILTGVNYSSFFNKCKVFVFFPGRSMVADWASIPMQSLVFV